MAAGKVAPTRDDRVLPFTRGLSIFIVPFLVVAWVILYLFPGHTARLWSWAIPAQMTSMVLASAYLGGAYFFVRVARERLWHRIQVGFLPVTAFTVFMAIATFLHLDRFETQHVAFWIWIGLYVTTPILVPLAWWRNRATDPGTPEPDEPPLPPHVRTALLVVGGVQSLVALVLLLWPSMMIEHWPWLLTPLTAQTLGGWFALPGVTALMMGADGRWSAIKITLESQLIGLALILLATARAWEQFDKSNALTYAFAGAIALLLVGLGTLWCSMALRRPRPRPTPPHGRSLTA
jgi:hypothetical protein